MESVLGVSHKYMNKLILLSWEELFFRKWSNKFSVIFSEVNWIMLILGSHVKILKYHSQKLIMLFLTVHKSCWINFSPIHHVLTMFGEWLLNKSIKDIKLFSAKKMLYLGICLVGLFHHLELTVISKLLNLTVLSHFLSDNNLFQEKSSLTFIQRFEDMI